MKRVILAIPVLLLLSFGTSSSQPVSVNEKLHLAEEAYLTGDYGTAIDSYESIIESGWSGGMIYYNLGNSYYKIGQYGKAILSYERARRILGNDKDLMVNLKLANLHISDRIEPLPRFFLLRIFEGVGAALPVPRWAIIFLVAEWVLAMTLIGLFTVRKFQWRRLLVVAFVVTGVIFILSGGFFLQQKIYRDSLTEGVVLLGDVAVRSAPESDATKLFTLHEGAKMRILRDVSGWSEILLADGKKGWIPEISFETI